MTVITHIPDLNNNLLPFFIVSFCAKSALSYLLRNNKPKNVECIGHVTSLRLHPVKSMRTVQLSSLTCTDIGVKHPDFDIFDRSFLVVRENGSFLTCRVLPRMAAVKCSIEKDAIVLGYPGMPDMKVPGKPEVKSAVINSRVWDEYAEGRDCGDNVAEWLQKCLELPNIRLVRGDTDLKKRHLIHRKDKWTKTASYKDKITFQDRFPFHIVSEKSLDDLNERLEKPVTMERFRPNIVVAGCPSFDDDTWDDIWIGDVKFRNLKPCQRCLSTVVDPETETKDDQTRQPLTALSSYRLTCPDDYPRCPIFGSLLVLDSRSGTVAVGDKVYVTRKSTRD